MKNSNFTELYQPHFNLILGSHRNPSTAFYQAFHLNTFQESKNLWDRYEYLRTKCIHARVYAWIALHCTGYSLKPIFILGGGGVGSHMGSSVGQSSKINQNDELYVEYKHTFLFIVLSNICIYFFIHIQVYSTFERIYMLNFMIWNNPVTRIFM